MDNEKQNTQKEEIQQRMETLGMTIFTASLGAFFTNDGFIDCIRSGKWLDVLLLIVINAVACVVSWAFLQAVVVQLLEKQKWFQKIGRFKTPLLMILCILLSCASYYVIFTKILIEKCKAAYHSVHGLIILTYEFQRPTHGRAPAARSDLRAVYVGSCKPFLAHTPANENTMPTTADAAMYTIGCSFFVGLTTFVSTQMTAASSSPFQKNRSVNRPLA